MNTEALLTLSQIAILLGVLLTGFGGYGSFYYGKKASDQATKDLDREIKVLKEGNQRLEEGNTKVQSMLEPFLDLAAKKYPGTEQQEALQKLRTDLDKTMIDIKKSKRGFSSSYDFNGIKREMKGPGQFHSEIGAEYMAFQEFQKLAQEKKFNLLQQKLEEQIKKTPEWLTPYLFLGLGYADGGNLSRARELLRHVVNEAPGDPNYKQAEEVLKKIGP